MRRSENRGFIALISAIIITTVLITFVISVGVSGFFTRFDILSAEIKEISQSIAEGCAHTAILQISQGSVPGGVVGEINIDGNTCLVNAHGADFVEVQAVYNDSYTNIRATFNPGDFSITDWQEVASF